MRLQPNILCERSGLLKHSVTYSQERSDFHADELRRQRFTLFFYEWTHIPTGKQGISRLWVFRQADALALVNYWSGDDWAYRLLKKNEKNLTTGGINGILPVVKAKGENEMTDAAVEPVKAKYPEIITDAIAKTIITPLIKVSTGETVDIRRASDPQFGRCFRVNVWTSTTARGDVIADNRIDRSFFVTILSDEVQIE